MDHTKTNEMINYTVLLATVLAIEFELMLLLVMLDRHYNIPCNSISSTETETFQTSRVPLNSAI